MAPCHTLLSFILTVTATLAAASPAKKSTFMVQVHHEAKPSIFPTHKHWYESSLASIINHATVAETTTTAASAAVLHTYDTVFHGFSAKLSPLEAQKLESLSHVVAVIPEQVRQLHTTRSLQFLGLKTADRAGLLKETDFDSDLIIGVIDTGIYPDRESFNDCNLGPVPPKWKGSCVAGRDFPATLCNRKIIGACYFSAGYEATNGKMNDTLEYRSPRDSDILAAFDAAVADGVNVVSLSVGGVVVPYYLDVIDIERD